MAEIPKVVIEIGGLDRLEGIVARFEDATKKLEELINIKLYDPAELAAALNQFVRNRLNEELTVTVHYPPREP